MLVGHLFIRFIGIMFVRSLSLPRDSSMSDGIFVPIDGGARNSNLDPQNMVDQNLVAQNLIAQSPVDQDETSISASREPIPEGFENRLKPEDLPVPLPPPPPDWDLPDWDLAVTSPKPSPAWASHTSSLPTSRAPRLVISRCEGNKQPVCCVGGLPWFIGWFPRLLSAQDQTNCDFCEIFSFHRNLELGCFFAGKKQEFSLVLL